jgi:hypothetical protein
MSDPLIIQTLKQKRAEISGVYWRICKALFTCGSPPGN